MGLRPARWCKRPVPPPGTHTLQLARVQPSDSGTYTCEALSAAGQDQKLVQLSVLGTSCLSPKLHCPPLLQEALSPQDSKARRGAAGPGEAGVPMFSGQSWEDLVWRVGLAVFQTQLGTYWLRDLGQVTLPLGASGLPPVRGQLA